MPESLELNVPALAKRLEEIAVREKLPGLAVGIVRDQELAWSGGFGHADLKTRRVPDRQTLFRVASITKTLTAAAVLQLRDEGRLSLDDPLSRHLPEFAQATARAGSIDKVTLRRMLSHHSGLTSEAPLPCWDALEFPTRDALLAVVPKLEVVIPQDSAFKYSNLAFGLLGEVVTRASGLSYDHYLKTRVLEPLGMTSSVLELTAALRPRLAVGHYPAEANGEFPMAPYIRLNGLGACGQLHSCVEDLAKWISLQFCTADSKERSPVLSPATLEEMHRPQYLEPDWSTGYCLGWRATRSGNRVYHGHGGGLHGFASYILFHKPQKLGVICLSNVWPHPGLVGSATEIANWLLDNGWTAPDAPRPPAPKNPAWDALLGVYEATPRIFVEVAYRDGALRLEPTSHSKYLLHAPAVLEPADSSTVFTVRGGRGAGERVEFRPGERERLQFGLGGFVYRKKQ